MVKLASARESRMYGPRLGRNRAEYINAGVYVFATVVLMAGFVALFSSEPRSGLVLLLIAFALIMAVNIHDLFAHLAGIDFYLPLWDLDVQLALVEFAVPLIQTLGALLFFLAILFLFIQEGKGYGYNKLEKHAVNMLIAGPALWVVGSIHNVCQVYQRADVHVQILQDCVQIPFLMGSILFLVGAILNSREQAGMDHHGLELPGAILVWMAIFGSIMLFVGGLANVVKIFKIQQIDGPRLEKLRGGAQELLMREREAEMPLIMEEEQTRRRAAAEGTRAAIVPAPTPYKDVLVGQT